MSWFVPANWQLDESPQPATPVAARESGIAARLKYEREERQQAQEDKETLDYIRELFPHG
jgi:hypothetical protein